MGLLTTLNDTFPERGRIMNRRNWITGIVGGAAGLFAASTCSEGFSFGNKKKLPKYPNDYFYKNGEFNPEAAKKAYFELFDYHDYSLAESLKDNPDFWVAEFGLGDYTNVGMAGIFWVNDKEHGYFGHEIYLLPGQMIPEHAHAPAEGKPAKHECWQVRHGSIYTFGVGEPTKPCPVELPESQLESGGITCFKCNKLEVGDMEYLSDLEDPHFMYAGPEGAIVTEYASYHSGEGLRFTNKKAAL